MAQNADSLPGGNHDLAGDLHGGACDMDRRQFGRLLAGAGGAAFFGYQPARDGAGRHSDAAAASSSRTLTLRCGRSNFTIDTSGAVSAITVDTRNLLAPEQPSPLLSLRIAGKIYAPSRASWNDPGTRVKLAYEAVGGAAVVAVQAKPTHVRFELIELHAVQPVELVLWGPYATSVGDLVGEIVGVARNSDFAIGIQALNARTLGGYPSAESDIEPEGVLADDPGIYPDLPEELRQQQLWRGDTAQHADFGSTLQAYCRNRTGPRTFTNWGNDQFTAPPFQDGGVIGSKIALFACPEEGALPVIGEIEVAEGLPHPILDGKWAKMDSHATASYLIVDFGEATIDLAIRMTQKAGLRYLYQSSPFSTWGHFRLKPELFPNGWDGFRECVAKARQAGIGLGFHTLSNFVTPNDPYVTPKPDPRLARTGASRLTAAIDAVQTEIPVADAEWFRKKTPMSTVVIEEELIRYDGISAEAPWRLLNCERGAWGTHATAHPGGEGVGKLMDHDYKVFLTDTSLAQDIARNIAAFCAHTEAKQLSFDGLEGNWSTGMGQYGCVLFSEAWYKALPPNLRGHIINDASNAHHFTWHIATRYNWGEPWYAGFRQSQTLYRMKNQLFFTRNLLPRMLGWFSLRQDTSQADVEWLCARAAGYDAGFALAASFDSQAKQSSANLPQIGPDTQRILAVVSAWETARQSGAFPDSVKADLRDTSREFRLLPAGSGAWDLQPVHPPGPAMRIGARPERMREWLRFDGSSA